MPVLHAVGIFTPARFATCGTVRVLYSHIERFALATIKKNGHTKKNSGVILQNSFDVSDLSIGEKSSKKVHLGIIHIIYIYRKYIYLHMWLDLSCL